MGKGKSKWDTREIVTYNPCVQLSGQGPKPNPHPCIVVVWIEGKNVCFNGCKLLYHDVMKLE